jgi:hypothetical protein
MISDERRQEVRDRLAKATPGPWRSDLAYGVQHIEAKYQTSNAWFDVARSWSDEDTALIAHAPQDIAALLAENEELRAKVQRVLRVCDEADAHDHGHGHWVSTRFVRIACEDLGGDPS